MLPVRRRLAALPPRPSQDVKRDAFRLRVAPKKARYGDHVGRAIGVGTFQGERSMTLTRRRGVLQETPGVPPAADAAFIPEAAT